MSKIGIIGGTGLYEMESFHNKEWIELETPFGKPSDSYLRGKLGEKEVLFLPRHGRGHTILPGELNYRANIYGFKKLGVERLIAVSAVGSLKKKLQPLDIFLPDQFFNRTSRADTFFGEGIAAHISFADPICPYLIEILAQAARKMKARVHKGGTYVNIEGPAFSTRAESGLYQQWGMDIIGMTSMVEAKLAREAEMCYANMAMITDYDCWHGESVTVDIIIENLKKNTNMSMRTLRRAVELIDVGDERSCFCRSALKDAIVTDREKISPEVIERLGPLVKNYLK
ncbi:MAG: S-methyl-5'-thioadenosine phosphorylase [Syntrophomonadaceae bacterium]|nr:S-methyl-5'-thioadenosine phosphorylase [Bacillota bacterium]